MSGITERDPDAHYRGPLFIKSEKIMPTRRSVATARKTSTRGSKGSAAYDAVSILTSDHDKVKKLFKEFASLHDKGNDAEAEEIAKQICNELTIHATVEEEIFYPELRAAIDDEELMNEADVEHASAKDLIGQIESMSSGNDMYAAKVIVLGEYINHHVEEEQGEMFPKAKRAKVDLTALGEKMMMRKQALMAEMGIEENEDEELPRTKRPPRNPRSPARAR